MSITQYYRAMREAMRKGYNAIRVGDVVEVLNQDGEVPGNLGFCARGARGRVKSIHSGRVTIDINGREGSTNLSNVIRYKP